MNNRPAFVFTMAIMFGMAIIGIAAIGSSSFYIIKRRGRMI